MLHAYSLNFRIENKYFEFLADPPNHFKAFLKINKFKITKNFQKNLDTF